MLNKNHIISFFILLTLILFSGQDLYAQKRKKKKDKKSKKELRKEEEAFKEEYIFVEGVKYYVLGKDTKSYAAFEEVLDMDPNNSAAHYKLAELYFEDKELEKSLFHINKAIENDEPNEFFYLLKARIFERQSKLDAAIDQYELIIEHIPGSEQYYLDIASLYASNRNYEKAILAYEKVQETMGVDPDIVRQKQFYYLKLGELDKAIQEGESLIEAYPDIPIYKVYLAELLYSNDRYDEAEQLLLEILDNDPDDPHTLTTLTRIYQEQGKEEKYRNFLQKTFENESVSIGEKTRILTEFLNPSSDSLDLVFALKMADLTQELHPEESKTYAIKGDIYLRLKNYEAARTAYRKALQYDEDNYDLWKQLIVLDSELNQIDSMIVHAMEATELFPNQAMFWYYAGTGYSINKDYEKAVDLLEQAKILSLTNPSFLQTINGQLADNYYYLDMYPQSDAAYEEVLKMDANNAHALNNYSYFLSLRKDKLEKAKEMSEKLVTMYPNNPTYLDTHAWVLYVMGKYEEAKIQLEKAVKNSNDGTILEHYGDVLFRLGATEEAIKYWEKAKEQGGATDLIDKKIADRKLYE